MGGHTLDVVITRDTDNILSNVAVIYPGLSDNIGKVARDHFAVTLTVKRSTNKSCEIEHLLKTANVPKSFKISRIIPLLKKPGLDQNKLKNSRHVSNLPFMSKVKGN